MARSLVQAVRSHQPRRPCQGGRERCPAVTPQACSGRWWERRGRAARAPLTARHGSLPSRPRGQVRSSRRSRVGRTCKRERKCSSGVPRAGQLDGGPAGSIAHALLRAAAAGRVCSGGISCVIDDNRSCVPTGVSSSRSRGGTAGWGCGGECIGPILMRSPVHPSCAQMSPRRHKEEESSSWLCASRGRAGDPGAAARSTRLRKLASAA